MLDGQRACIVIGHRRSVPGRTPQSRRQLHAYATWRMRHDRRTGHLLRVIGFRIRDGARCVATARPATPPPDSSIIERRLVGRDDRNLFPRRDTPLSRPARTRQMSYRPTELWRPSTALFLFHSIYASSPARRAVSQPNDAR